MSSGTPMVRAADIRHDWYVVDASDQVLGRLASAVARVLSGKHRPNWVAHLDTGDFVVVTHAERVKLTGRKADEKVYHRHTGYPGGLKTVAAPEMQREVSRAHHRRRPFAGCCRRPSSADEQFKKLKVYRGASHPHEAQRPKPLERPRQVRAKQ